MIMIMPLSRLEHIIWKCQFLMMRVILFSWDVLAGQEVQGDCVVIGGGLVGAETAEYLANKGHHVTIVEMMDKIASGESTTVLPLMMKDFAEHKRKTISEH